MNVLIIPEDFRNDQYIVKPIVSQMLAKAGKPRANVRVCLDPLMGGVTEATNWIRIKEVLDRYRGMVQVFLLIVDRDGKAGRRARLDDIEQQASEELGDGLTLLAENAWQEIEVWAIAGQDLPKDWKWKEIREEPHPKEIYFEPLVKSRGLANEPGKGRTTLGREAAKNYNRVRARCQEDVEALENRLKDWFGER